MSVLLDHFLFKVYCQVDCFHHNTEKTRDELREQVYDAMSEKRDSQEGEPKVGKEEQVAKEEWKESGKDAAVGNGENPEAPVENSTGSPLKREEQTGENVKEALAKDVSSKQEDALFTKEAKEDAEQAAKSKEEKHGDEEPADAMAEDAGRGRGVEYRAHGCMGQEMGYWQKHNGGFCG